MQQHQGIGLSNTSEEMNAGAFGPISGLAAALSPAPQRNRHLEVKNKKVTDAAQFSASQQGCCCCSALAAAGVSPVDRCLAFVASLVQVELSPPLFVSQLNVTAANASVSEQLLANNNALVFKVAHGVKPLRSRRATVKLHFRRESGELTELRALNCSIKLPRANRFRRAVKAAETWTHHKTNKTLTGRDRSVC